MILNVRLYIVFFVFLNKFAISQVTYFEKIYGTAQQDLSRSIVQISSGSLFVLGNSGSGNLGSIDISLIKLDRYGNEEWTNYYGDANLNNGYCISKCSDGNIIAIGDAQVSPGDTDILIYKLDTLGGVIWSYTYSTTLNESAKFIEQTMDGGYIAVGFQTDAFGFNNSFVLKIDGAGNFLWSKSIGGADNDYASAIKELPSGNLILTADTKSHGAGGYDVELSKLSSVGDVIWQYTYGDSVNNGCQGLYLSSDFHLLSYGETERTPSSYFDMFLEKIDTNGVSIWKNYYGDSNRADACFSISENAAGEFFLTGYSNTFNGGQAMDLALLKTDANGNQLWGRGYGGQGVDIGYSIIPSMNNGFYIVGKYFDVEFSDDQYYLLHVDDVFGGLSSIIELSSVDFSIFPNPSNGKFWIDVNRSINDYQLRLYSILGDLVYDSKVINSNDFETIELNIASGVYVVELSEGIRSSRKKLVIN
jgi:hypothetical protein